MTSTRLEAFSDAVIAVIITIMVLEMKAPHEAVTLEAFKPLLTTFITYILSFFSVGIYWNNHHHLLQSAKKVNGKILWANLHLLFWLSLIPFFTSLMDESNFASLPVAPYGLDLFFAAVAYHILTRALITHHGKGSLLAKAHGY